jgi:Fic family protein
MPLDPAKPYNDLPDLPPAAQLETRPVLKACIEARAALAALRQAASLIPNPTVLSNTMPLLEAQASSEIENIVTTTDALFRYSQLDERAADPATREALRNRTALNSAFRSIKGRPLSTATAIEICTGIKNVQMEVRRIPGTALANNTTGTVIYTPPVGEALLRDKLTNWERFVHGEDDLDPLVRMAVAHYQFEAIHPFTDGNGRTGRILNLLMLVERGLLDEPILYLSKYIIENRPTYYRLLLDVTVSSAWEPWILYMLAAVLDTARWTRYRITAIKELMQVTADDVRAKAPKIYSRDLVDVLFNQPYCRIENLVDAGIAKRETASRYLKVLTAANLLREEKIGREKLFVNPQFLALLTDRDGRSKLASR